MTEVVYHPESESLFVSEWTPELANAGCHDVDPCKLSAGSKIRTTLYYSEVLPSMDFETYSEAGYVLEPQYPHGDVIQPSGRKKWIPPYRVRGVGPQGKGGLPVVGTPVYAEHSSTEILCLCYDLKDGRGRRRWYPGFPAPSDLLEYIRSGGLIEAWNVTFEWYIWNLVAVRMFGWPPLELWQCRCAMAKARRYSLAGKLATTCSILGTVNKDSAGTSLIRRLSVPLTPTKNRPAHRWTPATNWSDFCRFYDYNEDDVVAEDHASARIPDLTPYELRTWQMDQRINARGVPVDVETLDAALVILDQASERYNARLCEITGGAVETVSQNARFIAWVQSRGVRTSSLDEDHRAALLKGDLPDDVRKALEIAEAIMSANVKKLRTLKLRVSSDGRLRDQYTYCGADRTGRWSAGGVQLQNITAKGPKSCRCESCEKIFGYGDHMPLHPDGGSYRCCPRCGSWLWHDLDDWTIEAVEQAIKDIHSRDLDYIEKIWGHAVPVLTGCLRGLFKAKPGHKFVCCDFSAIEAVAAACLARCTWRIEVFSTHGKIYEASAAKATGIPLEEILEYKKRTKSHHPARKGIGKIRELAGGYGGWIQAWKNFGAEAYFSDDAEIKADVLKWREESPEIVEMWGGQFRWVGPGKWDYAPELFGLEGAAINAILHPGQHFSHNDITYAVADDVLFCRLPSGRFLYYHRPRLHEGQDRLNRGPCWQITYEGYNSNPQKGPVGWGRWDTYGPKLFENVVQAACLDIQAEALGRCEDGGYPIVMHTHDEGVAEVPDSPEWNVDGMSALMVERSAWFNWWPIRAAGWEHQRYQKD